jgi:hypothetical protein
VRRETPTPSRSPGASVERRLLLLLLGALLLLLLLTVMPPLRRRRADVRDGVTAGESSSGSDKSAHDVDELQALRFAGSSESDSYSSERLDVELDRAWLGRVRGAPPLC